MISKKDKFVINYIKYMLKCGNDIEEALNMLGYVSTKAYEKLKQDKNYLNDVNDEQTMMIIALNEQIKVCGDRVENLINEKTALCKQIEELQIKMKCCGNCKHNPRLSAHDDTEFCWSCERQSSNGEEIIKDEWELAE